jgi:phospholipid/cholesterol/gamma-HCH transport system permease protein
MKLRVVAVGTGPAGHLLTIGVLMSVGGGLLVANLMASIAPEEYLRHVGPILQISSVLGGVFKCLVFALMLATVCTYRGYITTGGARGVGLAVVQTAMATMVGIVVADWITSQISETAAKVLGALWL